MSELDRRGQGRITDELHALARERASGTLNVGGDRGGTIYLDGGRLTFAEAAGVPDLAARLIGSGRLPADRSSTLHAQARPPGELAVLLVEQGDIGEDEMRAVVRSVSLDAITALAMPGRPSVGGIRFAPLERPWIGPILDLDVESVLSEVAPRTRLLAGYDISLDDRPQMSDLRRPLAVVGRAQWMVACGIDGVMTLRELAWRNGSALYDTMENVAGLVRAGLCTLQKDVGSPGRDDGAGHGRPVDETDSATMELPKVPGPAPTARSPQTPPSRTRTAGADGPPVDSLPRRRPGMTTYDRTPAGAVLPELAQGPSGAVLPPVTPIHDGVLERVLEGLKRMG
ncbi:hypothetical protein N5079_00450 [Planotetraspora sp. A-T 1434]|uniref:DUF4388 domain-containing protein n=1 Tax=Planotetraspora sp. A-T 1434 TaxID=2979219 RepID=UPI0021C21CCF|nr:DUF4388 domain-containing protein [Planotetraspora sp. A-T 1434]MCT9928680.1 hypothetical protein [Planotetraspora sp. A-T 1434]